MNRLLNRSVSQNFWIVLSSAGILTFFLMGGCQSRKNNPAKNAVAQAYGVYLTRNELSANLPPNVHGQDSVQAAQQYINGWLKERALLTAAERFLPDSEKNFSSQLDDYRNSLIIYSYERELIKQKLDTAISDSAISSYFADNKKDFQLHDFLLKCIYVKINQEAPKRENLEKWLNKGDDESLNKLEEYAYKYAENYSLNTDDWIFMEDLQKELPVQPQHQEDILKKGVVQQFEDGNYVYYLKVLDFKLKDSTAPLSVVREEVRNILLNKRKVDLLSKLRQEIFDDAYAAKKLTILKDS